MNIDRNQFARIIKEKRKDFGFTQSDMAEYLGISRPAYAQYETKKNIPRLEHFLMLSAFFDIKPEILAGVKE